LVKGVTKPRSKTTTPTRKALTGVQIAAEWNVDPSYVSRARSEKGMPPVFSKEEANNWRAMNMPPNPNRQFAAKVSRAKDPAAAAAAAVASLPPPPASKPPEQPANGQQQGSGEPDVEPVFEGSYEEVSLQQWVIAKNDAFRMLRLAGKMGGGALKSALSNFASATTLSMTLRKQLLDEQLKRKELITIEEIKGISGGLFGVIANRYEKLGATVAPKLKEICPGLDLIAAQEIIDEHVDEIRKMHLVVVPMIEKELAAGPEGGDE
jgi:hypothetical protein